MGHERLGDFGHDARHSGMRWESTGKLVRWACGMVRHMEGRCSDLEPVNADYTCADKVSPCRYGYVFCGNRLGFGICYPSGIVVTEKESVRVYVKEG